MVKDPIIIHYDFIVIINNSNNCSNCAILAKTMVYFCKELRRLIHINKVYLNIIFQLSNSDKQSKNVEIPW